MQHRSVRYRWCPWILGVLALVLVLAACQAPAGHEGASDAHQPAALATTPTLEQAKSASYRGLDIDGHDLITLQDGRWSGTGSLELLDPMYALADVDGDGVDEAVVGLLGRPAGPAEILYFAALRGRGTSIENVATTRIGDRVQVMRFAGDGEMVVADLIVGGPEDAACCPTQMIRKHFTLDGAALIESGSEELGTFTLAEIPAIDWRLVSIGGDPVPSEVEVTARFADGTVAGHAGCNTYLASYSSSNQSPFTIDATATTRMLCPEPWMAVEERFLEAFGAVLEVSFHAGQLLLPYVDGGGYGLLFFERKQ